MFGVTVYRQRLPDMLPLLKIDVCWDVASLDLALCCIIHCHHQYISDIPRLLKEVSVFFLCISAAEVTQMPGVNCGILAAALDKLLIL